MATNTYNKINIQSIISSLRIIFAMSFAFIFISSAKVSAISFNFDYNMDMNGFFNDQIRKDTLNKAANYYETILIDHLSAITPDGFKNNWFSEFHAPDTGMLVQQLNHPSDIMDDVIYIYVGGRPLGKTSENDFNLGLGERGGYKVPAEADQSFKDTVQARGQAGALTNPQIDVGPWGGSIAFNNDASVKWFFDPTLKEDITKDSFDFFSVALHEIAHVLGFGNAGAWNSKVVDGRFTGINTRIRYGWSVPLERTVFDSNIAFGHYSSGIIDSVYCTYDKTPQNVAMDTLFSDEIREYLTELDVAGLKDIGWQIKAKPVPEPSTIAMIIVGVAGIKLLKNRFKSK